MVVDFEVGSGQSRVGLLIQEVKVLLAQQGAQAFVSRPEAFLERLRANVAMWSKVVSDAGIKRQ